MPKARFDAPHLTDEEITLLLEATKDYGVLSADVLVDGEFSEAGFFRFSALERLALRGYLAHTGQRADARNTSYYYAASTCALRSAAGASPLCDDGPSVGDERACTAGG
jgi:hypothetical protein